MKSQESGIVMKGLTLGIGERRRGKEKDTGNENFPN